MTSKKLDAFLPEIFDLEARAMFASLSKAPSLQAAAKEMTGPQIEHGVDYIKTVLVDVYRTGSFQIPLSALGDELCGYAIIYRVNENAPLLLHSIFVKEPYRRNGLGRMLLEPLFESKQGFNLISPLTQVGFFERSGLKLLGPYQVHEHPTFSLLIGHYADTFLMGDRLYPGGAPVFLLNNNDLQTIFALR
ncbi:MULTISPECIES: GNAT family N-acetyltransferase [Pseudomonas syringae group]|uniref:N-acetyltransferase domain-containing protein n=1 Tax=Pseudomonas cannabina TaxID=86840 RepID=A0A3M3KDF7_PSECA|nr:MULTISPECIES: GNAT family N-acetyltransferase [Pseudomonas syringae group]MDH4602348.1 GNAT family N-acetyltransferase [Pseudomonas syringae pv. papulans]RMN20395.1 hypothetical protein ALQ64_00204 [Pseudomonas cannabina]